MKKILFVMPALYGGGAEKSLVNLLNLIDYKKYAVDLLLFKQEGLFLTQIPKEVRLLPLTASLRYAYKIDMGMFGSLSGFKTGMLRLMGTVVCKVLYKEKAGQQRWVKCYKHCLPNLEGNYDIAVGFLEGEASYYVIDKVNAEKKILWIHNDFNEIKKNEDAKIYENYFQKADSVVSISDKCVQILKQNYPKLTNKFYCLPNLTSGSLLKKMSEEFEVPEYEKNKFNILSIGRLTRQKGYDFAIDAMKILKKKYSDMLIIGSIVTVAEYRICGRVEFYFGNLLMVYGMLALGKSVHLKDNILSMIGSKHSLHLYLYSPFVAFVFTLLQMILFQTTRHQEVITVLVVLGTTWLVMQGWFIRAIEKLKIA